MSQSHLTSSKKLITLDYNMYSVNWLFVMNFSFSITFESVCIGIYTVKNLFYIGVFIGI